MRRAAESVAPIDVAETFTGTVEAARVRARQIINESRFVEFARIVEGWRQLPDGLIEFTIRTLVLRS